MFLLIYQYSAEIDLPNRLSRAIPHHCKTLINPITNEKALIKTLKHTIIRHKIPFFHNEPAHVKSCDVNPYRHEPHFERKERKVVATRFDLNGVVTPGWWPIHIG